MFQSLIVTLVRSRLDYCNSVLFGLPDNLTQRLQSVQNAAARLIFRIRRSEHITPSLINLHWLRVPERISFRLSVMAYRSIHDNFSSYLVGFHPCWRHDIQTTAVLFYLSSSGSSFRSSLYSRHSASGRFQFLVQPAGTTCLLTSHLRRHSRFSDLSVLPFLSRHYNMTQMTITIYH